jgi:NAD-dependent deacetylase
MNEARGFKRIAVLTGAGISTDSGIPDYRGPDGVWTKDPAAATVFTYQDFMADTAVRQALWQRYVAHPVWHAEPNAAHHALAALDSPGRAVRILTQNIDGLHQRTTIPARKVLELHGSLHSTVCTGCGAETPTRHVLTRVTHGDADPTCPSCEGILKPDIVLFGQLLDNDIITRARTIAAASDLFLAIGSSLQVEPAASLCALAVEAGAKLVIVNRDPTPYDAQADKVIRTPIGTAVPHLHFP